MKKATKIGKLLKTKVSKALLIIPAMICLILGIGSVGPTETAIRHRAVKLLGVQGGACSGVQVKAPSGADYILTAGHCKVLISDGSIIVVTEDGQKLSRKVIAEDPISDLLLLEGLPRLNGLDIASSDSPGQHVRTFTHGAALDTYKTEGVIVQDLRITVLDHVIMSAGDCQGPKYKIVSLDSLFGAVEMCTMDVIETVSTAMTVPGSSGGMIVDDSGQLVGIVSAGDGHFSMLVRLSDIRAFLAGY